VASPSCKGKRRAPSRAKEGLAEVEGGLGTGLAFFANKPNRLRCPPTAPVLFVASRPSRKSKAGVLEAAQKKADHTRKKEPPTTRRAFF